MRLVALLCIFSSVYPMSFLRYGRHACIQYSLEVRSNYCFIQRYNQLLSLCYISPNHSKNLVTLRRCNSVNIHCYP